MWAVIVTGGERPEVVGMAVEKHDAGIILEDAVPDPDGEITDQDGVCTGRSRKDGRKGWLQECAVTDDQGSTDTVVVVRGVGDEERRAGNFEFCPHRPDELMSNADLVRFHLGRAVGARLNELVSNMKWTEGKFWNDPNLKNEHPHPSVIRPVEGSYDCPTSPTKLCWYDDSQDERWDFCLFCGEPHERK